MHAKQYQRATLKHLYKRIGIYSLIVVTITTIFLNVPGYKNEVSPLGSVLSVYFYSKHSTAENAAMGYMTYENHLKAITDPDLKKFYKHLAWEEKGISIDFASSIDNSWQLYTPEGTIKPNYLQYWQSIRSEIREFYQANIAPITIYDPVVHFRCSDAPFVTHPQYHLTKAATVQWMAAELKARGYNKITFLTCHKHRRMKGKNRCADFAAFYEKIFTTAGIKVVKQCHSVYKDFAIMVNAPLLVSLNASSFAFMAGIAKDPHNYISCNLGREHGGEYLLQNSADWIMDTRAPLLHKDAGGYKDSRVVIAKLQN
ncbi:MAG TPA: hypothetical protein VLG38_06935 [Gammaproteobacteria bacterium]|nr:hypothetical protein [Gammaproteobacteria bacterium]